MPQGTHHPRSNLFINAILRKRYLEDREIVFKHLSAADLADVAVEGVQIGHAIGEGLNQESLELLVAPHIAIRPLDFITAIGEDTKLSGRTGFQNRVLVNRVRIPTQQRA